MRGVPGGFPGGVISPGGSFGFGGGGGLAPDPKTLHAIAVRTGGKFFRARSAGAAQAAYSELGSKLGRAKGTTEVTSWFLAGSAFLLVLAGVLSALWAP